MELSDSFLDAAERFDDVFVARCIAHAEAFGRTESSTTDSGHMAYFKQIKGEIHRVVDGASAVGHTEIVAALGEEIEGTMGVLPWPTSR